ncbi:MULTISPECIES: hypothetical protein [Rhizobium]|uniref:hypothetical protein n=1 Tax=Rhizobium TaxID=379 RepID=UPI001884A159|nr:MULTISPECIES: hypothetical protein [Rhizobium]
MALRSLIFGVTFIAILVAIVLSIGWIDKTQPLHQPDPLAPATVPSQRPPAQ